MNIFFLRYFLDLKMKDENLLYESFIKERMFIKMQRWKHLSPLGATLTVVSRLTEDKRDFIRYSYGIFKT